MLYLYVIIIVTQIVETMKTLNLNIVLERVIWISGAVAVAAIGAFWLYKFLEFNLYI